MRYDHASGFMSIETLAQGRDDDGGRQSEDGEMLQVCAAGEQDDRGEERDDHRGPEVRLQHDQEADERR